MIHRLATVAQAPNSEYRNAIGNRKIQSPIAKFNHQSRNSITQSGMKNHPITQSFNAITQSPNHPITQW
jgi:hypothetical protein